MKPAPMNDTGLYVINSQFSQQGLFCCRTIPSVFNWANCVRRGGRKFGGNYENVYAVR